MTDKKRTWQAIDILIDADATEAAESALNELESLGTEVDSLKKPKNEPLIVTGFFDELPPADEVEDSVVNSLKIYGFEPDALKSITTRQVEETDWLAEWKKYWKPTPIGKFIIAPPWENMGETDAIVIRIEPNMAFGTGTHDTTQLCLSAISRIYQPEMSFLDVGTGTGILSIAAAKLGGKNILACDTDIDSVRIARENAVLNEAAEAIEFMDGPIGDQTPDFDFVCANLTIDVIGPIIDLLVAKTKSILLLSGILKEQQGMIESELSRFPDLNYEIEQSGEWISVTVSRVS